MLADINGNLADLRSEAAMASQRFCLRWNNHQSNLLSVFDQLLHDESFVDVTLAVEGHMLRAHKMVLSACSPYFQALFVNHPDKHPIVILKDVPYVDMRSLLDFMYRGEVSVDQDRLTAFLRVAESLRIKGLTEVNEDKCDLPSITSSLLSNQNQVPPPPPNLHRINQLSQQHHMPQKRYHHMSSHPLLGSALTAPKRKRGRPRKLSGSSDTPMDTSLGQDQQCSGADLVQGSPEMMEMKMGLDFQSEVAHNSCGGNGSNNSASNGATTTGASVKKDEPTENGTIDQSETPLLARIKGEPEPTPSTSAQAKDESFTRPHSRQGSESFKQDYPPTASSGSGSNSSSSSSTSSNSSVKSDSSDKSRGLSTPEKSTSRPATSDSPRPASNPPATPTTPTINSSSNSSSNNNNNNCSTTNNNNNNSSNNSSSNSNSISNNNNSSSISNRSPTPNATTTPSSPRSASAPRPAAQSPATGSMNAPTARQVPKRRMRRRATSQCQDPAEQLTEMSVRGLNLFRYASISEGVYQCTECAKVDIQKTFKNKYSFQRHAFLYHEGQQRKVFPCPVCGKEFSRPDKMKNHMKTVHDCFMPKDCVMPYGFFMPP